MLYECNILFYIDMKLYTIFNEYYIIIYDTIICELDD